MSFICKAINIIHICLDFSQTTFDDSSLEFVDSSQFHILVKYSCLSFFFSLFLLGDVLAERTRDWKTLLWHFYYLNVHSNLCPVFTYTRSDIFLYYFDSKLEWTFSKVNLKSFIFKKGYLTQKLKLFLTPIDYHKCLFFAISKSSNISKFYF